MTQIIIKDDGKHYQIELVGHATGDVKICAAISALMYTFVQRMRSLNEKDDNIRKYEDEINIPGYMALSFWYEGSRVKSVIETIETGLIMIAQDNPKVVKITREE